MDRQEEPQCRPLTQLAVKYSIWTLLFLTGCSPPPVAMPPEQKASQDSWESQLELVRTNQTKKILVREAQVHDQQLLALDILENLEELCLDAGKITDAGVLALVQQPALKRLRLRHSPLTDEGFATLAQCRSLIQINLPQAECTVAGIRHLRALQDLQHLRLASPCLSGSEVGPAIAELTSLRTVHLIDISLDEPGIFAIGQLPHLQSLYVDGANLSDATWERFFQAYPKIHVHIDQRHHDRDPNRHPESSQGK